MAKHPGIPPTLMGQGPVQRQAPWPPPKLTNLRWGTAIMRAPDGQTQLCMVSPDGLEGIALYFDAIGWSVFARDVQASLGANGAQFDAGPDQ